MKTPFLLFYAIAILLSLGSCKKCVTCKNVCYQCGSGANLTVLCSNDYANPASWNNTEEFLIGSGCIKIAPTEEFKVCDQNIESFIHLYERDNYFCDK